MSTAITRLPSGDLLVPVGGPDGLGVAITPLPSGDLLLTAGLARDPEEAVVPSGRDPAPALIDLGVPPAEARQAADMAMWGRTRRRRAGAPHAPRAEGPATLDVTPEPAQEPPLAL